MGAEYRLRVLRAAGGEFTAVGTSVAQTVPDGEDKVRGPFAVSLAVKTGDRIALEVLKGLGAPINIAPLAGELNYLQSPLADGSSEAPVLEPPLGSNQELLLSANLKAGPPVNLTLPTISGEARAGTPLQASEGSWEGASSYAFQWLRCLGACSPIAGATGREYTPTGADEGQQLRVDVTASGGGGSATASSSLTAGVKPAPPAVPANTALPSVSGEARQTETLIGSNGSWAGAPTRFEYEWLRCASATGTECAPIPGATALTYVPVRGDVGSTLRLRVSAVNGVGPGSAESRPTGIVQPLVVKAVLTVTPPYPCTGYPVQLDSTGSKTPNPPIVKYTYTYIDLLSVTHHTIYSGTSPSTSTVFTWNTVNDNPAYAKLGSPQREPVLITLTVTDLAGDSASANSIVQFYPAYAEEFAPQPPCGLPGRPLTSVFEATPRFFVVAKGSVSLTTRCVTAAPCASSLTIMRASSGAGRFARAGRPTVIASLPFFTVPAHSSLKLRAKLTNVGRHLLARGGPVHATARLTTIEPSGAKKVRVRPVLLKRR